MSKTPHRADHLYTLDIIDVGNVTKYSLHDLEPGVVYYFAVTAYDSERHESGYSNQVSTADTDNLNEFRSVGSGDSGADITGCFTLTMQKPEGFRVKASEGEVVVFYFETSATQDLKFSGFPVG